MSSYLSEPFLKFLPRDAIKLAIEIGSRDGEDAVAVANYFDVDRMFVFEPNPAAIPICRAKVAPFPKIELIEAAVYEKTGTIEFFPVVESYQPGGIATDNIGASSLYEASGLYGETYIQSRITVPSIRMDEFCADRKIKTIDLVCMDVQGAELDVLRSFGPMLGAVRYLITEATVVNQYVGQAQLYQINDFLVRGDFHLVAIDMAGYWGFGNLLYMNRAIEVPLVAS